MLSKYVGIAATILVLGMGASIYYLNGVIEDLNKEIGAIEVQLIACEASSNNLVEGIEKQNAKINEFNIILKTKNKVLRKITQTNEELRGEVSRKNLEIDSIELVTCDDAMQWMLTEALDEEDTTNISSP